MNRSEKIELARDAARGNLSSPDQARVESLLAADDEFRAVYEEERALEQILEALPQAPVSSNFTARVMSAVQFETRQKGSASLPKIKWIRWGWSAAGGLAMMTLGVVLVLQHQKTSEREAMAHTLTHFSEITSSLASDEVQPLDLLQDFEAIQSLAHIPADKELDLELLVALQK